MNDASLDRPTAELWASWFRALGDPTRVQILHLLALTGSPMSVGELTEALDVGQSTVSHHLATLAAVRFVGTERVGTSTRWTFNRACFDAFPHAAEIVTGRVPANFPPDMETTR